MGGERRPVGSRQVGPRWLPLWRRLRPWLEPSWPRLLLAVGLLAIADLADEIAGGSTFPGGPLDESAHALSALLVLWALEKSVRIRLLWPVLVGSVAIDLDHVPGLLGQQWLTAGTPRPYTHCLALLGALVLAGALWPGQRDLLLGVAAGVAIHFFRDLGEPATGVPLLWPLSYRAFSLPHVVYVLAMTMVVAIAWWRFGRSPSTRSEAATSS